MCSLLTRVDEASIVLLQSPSEESNPGKAKDWLCMKLIQEV